MKLDTINKEVNEVAVVGFGHIGLSLGLLICENDLPVTGIDINEDIVKSINQGQSIIEEVEIPEMVQKYVSKGLLEATTDYSKVKEAEVILVTVGTPVNDEYVPQMNAVESATRSMSKHLKKGQIIIFKSTLVPGVTEETIKPIIEQESDLKVGEDIHLAFCPERLAEGGTIKDAAGSSFEDLKEAPVIIGGINNKSNKIISEFWQKVGLDTISVSTPKDAEMAKLADNLWIDLNIALANEIALLAEEIGVDAMEVIEAANTLPKGQHMVNILYPGAGVGGYCLPKDPWFVHHLAKDYNLDLKIPKMSREINDSMPGHVVDLVEEELKKNDKPIEGSRITLFGLAFKNSTGDLRNTPAKKVIDILEEKGAEVKGVDAWVDKEEVRKELDVEYYEEIREGVTDSDCIIVMTGHPEFRRLDLKEISDLTSEKSCIIDGRSVYNKGQAEDAKFDYRRIGLGR